MSDLKAGVDLFFIDFLGALCYSFGMRLDFFVADKMNVSRTRAQNLIKEGCVFVEGASVLKPAFEIDDSLNVEIKPKDDYVSRGAYKLARAKEEFCLDFAGRVVLDMGSSTGGFTQVALKNEASKVYSVDVGHGELDKSLVADDRVQNREGTDIRTITKQEFSDVDMVVGDLSFISLKHILPVIHNQFGAVECALLFKPQFECGKVLAKKYKGVIKDKVIHKNLLKEFLEEIKIYNFKLSGLTHSSIKGKEGNIEYLVHLNGNTEKNVDISKIVEDAYNSLK